MLSLKFPLHIEIKITNKCNLNCIHCISNAGIASKNELKIEEIFDIINEAKKNAAFTIGLTGGEPFLRKDIFQIVNFIYKSGLKSTITTNGTILNKAIIEKIKDKVSLIRVSLDHFDSIKHDSFRRSYGAFAKTLNTLELLQKYEKYFQVVILTVVSKYNIEQLPKIISFFTKSKFKAVNFFLFVPFGRGKKLEKELSLDKKSIFKFCSFIEKEKHKNKKLKILTENPLLTIIRSEKVARICPAAITSCFITENGRVLPCPYFYSLKNYNDNIRQKSIKEIWINSSYFKDLRKINNLGVKCKICKFKSSCFGGCRAGAFNKFYTIKKSDPMCWL